ncbi:MAG: cytochrome c [Acidobacteriota bacterium]|nr:cytochrome c [Acidobacteriota bacterium]
MKILKTSLVFAAFAIFVIACNQNASVNTNPPANANAVSSANAPVQAEVTPAASDDLASARKIYSEKCVKCHKEDGTGGAVVFDDGTKIKAPNLTTDRQKTKPDSDYIGTIEKGAKEDGMPAFKGKISDDEIKNLVKYIRRNFQSKQ